MKCSLKALGGAMEQMNKRSCEYSYEELLAVVEKFMIDSGIREYCTEKCQGHCCQECRERRPETCFNTDGRRLACSVFLCSEMDYLLWQFDGYGDFQMFCSDVIRYLSNLYYFYRLDQEGNNPFFYPPCNAVITSFRWSRYSVERILSPQLAEKIKSALADVSGECRRPQRRSCF
jgi:hypothetical protein